MPSVKGVRCEHIASTEQEHREITETHRGPSTTGGGDDRRLGTNTAGTAAPRGDQAREARPSRAGPGE